MDPREDDDVTVTETEVAPVGRELVPRSERSLEERGAVASAKAMELLRQRLAAGAAEQRARGAVPAEEGPAWDRRDDYQQQVFQQAWKHSLERAKHTEYAKFSLADLDDSQHKGPLQRWVDLLSGGTLGKKNLVLYGGVGSGKTTAAIAAGNAAVQSGVMTRYVRHGDYLRWLRPDGAPPGMTATQVIEFHDRPRLLILDELCGEMDGQATEYVRRETGGLLDARLASGLATIVATNLSSPEIAAILGDRLLSRLGANAVALEFDHPDRREPVSWGVPRKR